MYNTKLDQSKRIIDYKQITNFETSTCLSSFRRSINAYSLNVILLKYAFAGNCVIYEVKFYCLCLLFINTHFKYQCNHTLVIMLRTLSCLNSMEVNSMEIEPSMPWARPCWIFFTGDCFQRILFGSELLLRVWDGVDRLIRLYVSQRLNSTKDLLTKQRHYSFLSLITAIFAVVWNLARRSGSCFAVSSAIYHVI